jgi:diguanylate cyclase (GGDEF)-like protein/PAS domain S-box-containing protein
MLPPLANETERLSALRDLRILDTPPEAHFDAVCSTAASLFSVPIALISLIDSDRQWFKAKCGTDVDGTSRDVALCAYTILSDKALIIEDATKDPRFAQNPLVTGKPGIRFYAGVPLILRPGIRLGTLCLIDTVPRTLSLQQREQLHNLARIVEAHVRLHEAHEAIKLREGAYRRVVEGAQDAFVSVNAVGVITRWNPVAEQTFGWSEDEAVGRLITETIVPERLRAAHDGGMRRYLATGKSAIVGNRQMQVTAVKRDGTEFPIEMSMSADRCGGVVTFNAFLRDVSERQTWEKAIQVSEARYKLLARHDALTDLPNRILFHERLDKALSESGKTKGGCALLYLDLDRFKTVNDTLGHLAGDTLLRQVAQRLKNAVREMDTVVRLGGDEFAIIQVDGASQPASSAALAQRVIEVMAEPFLIGGEQVEVGISIGIALAPQDADEADALVKRADLALYRAKLEGRNTRRFYEIAMDEALEYKRRLEMDLRGALTRGEFEVHYQPIMNAANGSISSVEALVRWRHPLHGLISPAAFIPLAEETGLIIPIGEWVLQTACQAASMWPRDVRIAVNVSAMQFRKGGLPEVVMKALGASGLTAQRLELEITESVLMQDGSTVMDTLHILRDFGVRTALDDFGTGYSSLSYLRRFPFDKLKIDRAFIQDIGNPSTAAIVNAIVMLGVALGMTITAEGIETEDQLTSMHQHGCNEIQGYLFSRPLQADALIQFMELGVLSTAAFAA